MTTTTLHREDVKALLRKRYGSLENFAVLRRLEAQAVRDYLRGRSKTAHEAVAAEVGVNPDQLIITLKAVPLCGRDSSSSQDPHRQTAGAK